jgi:protein CpxP
MTIKSIFYSAALTGCLLLPAVALPAGAFAQAQKPAGAASAGPKAAKSLSPTERVEQRISQLHAQLRITPAQQAQWDQFAQVMRENARNMEQRLEQRVSSFTSLNAADNLQSYAQVSELHAQDVKKLADAFQPVYAAMSDEQKKNADTVFRAHPNPAGHRKG